MIFLMWRRMPRLAPGLYMLVMTLTQILAVAQEGNIVLDAGVQLSKDDSPMPSFAKEVKELTDHGLWLGEGADDDGALSTQNLGVLASDTMSTLDDGQGVLTMESVTSVITNETQASDHLCGNGVRQGTEQCDDGNSVDGDGCSTLCNVEGGYECDLKMINDIGDRCRLCQDHECTIFFFGASRCLATAASISESTEVKTPLMHVRRISGFCKCAGNYCMDIDGGKCIPEADGWTAHTETNLCQCGLGYCLMPIANQVMSSPSKYQCIKLKPTMVRNIKTGICECAQGKPAVSSSDPALASPEKLAACKVYPSTPLLNIPQQGPQYAEFSCESTPYVKATDTDVCTNCNADSCKMPRPGVSVSNRNIGAIQPDQFYCIPAEKMQELNMNRNSDSSCACSQSECLMPFRDTLKCIPMEGSHPYGGVKLTDGKCGCAADAHACIMPTTPGGYMKASTGFLCLRLKEGSETTQFGEKYYRGRTGKCKCHPNRCRADPSPQSVGTFRCIDTESEGAYKQDETVVAAIEAGTSTQEDVPCACADGACMLPGDAGTISQCVTCPSTAGECVSKCSSDASGIMSCIKYCSTKLFKLKPAFGIGYGDMLDKSNMDARVTKCFIAKVITCETQPSGKVCSQKTTARAVYSCPGVYSKHTNRKLIDGTNTYGFKSVCSQSDFQCQKAKCSGVANPGVCLQGMILG